MPSALNAAAQRSSVGVSNRIAGLAVGREPAVAGHLLVELALAPAGIAERDEPLRLGPCPRRSPSARRSCRSSRHSAGRRCDACPARPNRRCGGRSPGPARPARRDAPAQSGASPGSMSELLEQAAEARCRRACGRCRCRPRHSRRGRTCAITARSKRGSAMPGMASSSLPDRKRGVVHGFKNEPRRRGGASLEDGHVAAPISRPHHPTGDYPMTIQVGDRIPDVPLDPRHARRPAAGQAAAIISPASASRCSRCPAPSRRPARPGTCRRYVEKAGELKAKGIDEIACISRQRRRSCMGAWNKRDRVSRTSPCSPTATASSPRRSA